MTRTPEWVLREDRLGPELVYRVSESGHPVARLRGRAPVGDAALGDPERWWRGLGYDPKRHPLVAPEQVHGTAVLSGRRVWALPQRPRVDGLELDHQDLWGSLRFADCFPVVLQEAPWGISSGRTLLLHAGYRGAVEGIVAQGLKVIAARGGAGALARLRVWIGPGIGPCCYSRHVDDPATRQGYHRFPEAFGGDGERLVSIDIVAMLLQQCDERGISRDAVCVIPFCTACAARDFYSYRRGDARARNFLFASGPQSSFSGDNLNEELFKPRSEDGA